jgi:hypothetical protein
MTEKGQILKKNLTGLISQILIKKAKIDHAHTQPKNAGISTYVSTERHVQV